jgi:hypothetical protein
VLGKTSSVIILSALSSWRAVQPEEANVDHGQAAVTGPLYIRKCYDDDR